MRPVMVDGSGFRGMSVWVKRAVGFALIGLLAGASGCGSLNELLVPLLPATETGGAGMTQPEVQTEVVTVIFRNLSTTDAVDVQFFVVEANLVDVQNELFVEENAVSRTLGVAGTGIMEPGGADIFEISCSDSLTLGTLGGSFFDNDTGDPTGVGSPRWVQEPGLGLCNSVVTIAYATQGNEFSTSITVERR